MPARARWRALAWGQGINEFRKKAEPARLGADALGWQAQSARRTASVQ